MGRLQQAVQQLKSKNQLILNNTDRALGLLPLFEAFNIPIKTKQDVNKFDTKISKKALQQLLIYLKGLNFDDIPIVGSEKGKIKIRKTSGEQEKVNDYIKKNISDLSGYGFGNGSIGTGGRQKISENTQELMVAALVLNKVKSTGLKTNEAIDMIEDAKKVFGKIEGATARADLADQFTGNFNDLATAISSSNSILKIVKNPTKVYWTGKGWHSDIAKYNPPIGSVRDYNSSDIVVKGGNKFYGFSLKKKSKSKDVDPTLINKPIVGKVGILKDILGADKVASIEKSKEIFFDYILLKHYKKSPKKLSDKEKKKLISDISQKQWGVYLKNPKNTFFRRVNQVLTNYADEFIKAFIELLFRTKMKDIEDGNQFKFYLLTGIGRLAKDEIIVEDADVKDMPQTIEALTRIFNSKIEMKKTPGKLNAWEKGAGAAKVFFTIFSDGNRIVDIEIRYKGSYTANPQFQAVATANFKAIFKK